MVARFCGTGLLAGMSKTLPVQSPYPLPDRVAEAMRRYRPRDLDASEWSELREEAIELVARARPTGEDDAKHLMSVLAGFVSWAQRSQNLAAGDVRLSEVTIDSYVGELGRLGLSPGTIRNKQARLRRLFHAQEWQGWPPRVKRPSPTQPYSLLETEALIAAGREDDALRLALAIGLATGLVIPAAWGAVPTVTGEQPGVRRADEHFVAADGPWSHLLREAPPLALQRDVWKRARDRTTRDQRLPALDHNRLRKTWLRDLLEAAQHPPADLLRHHRLDHKTLNALIPSLTTPPLAEVGALMRRA